MLPPHQRKLFIDLDIHKKTSKFHFTTDIVIGTGHRFSPSNKTIEKYITQHYKDYKIKCSL